VAGRGAGEAGAAVPAATLGSACEAFAVEPKQPAARSWLPRSSRARDPAGARSLADPNYSDGRSASGCDRPLRAHPDRRDDLASSRANCPLRTPSVFLNCSQVLIDPRHRYLA